MTDLETLLVDLSGAASLESVAGLKDTVTERPYQSCLGNISQDSIRIEQKLSESIRNPVI